ncbi:cytochrome bd-I oxidase subunit CydX [Proteus alimentorum]|uniref:Cytochrome bd-I oxidase subunit CydX n=1 Tax=Proteus alimentorum TaxID=1973495 RepID=A0ABS0IXR8_9GAMM|nr:MULTISPECIES: cytochrome bd-I oxidase subunit CydX [Enterobacterales]WOO50837.1 cytochrome bd-I oxidase subunit CydX [Hafnia alvei]MBG2877403.1 cytochrome bd-I oxidase subunit CydX [Proteus alimentorum]MBG2880842.1 cytochrome bd-I oxidase subunit CydX [Proteus alimentorum]MBQ0214697.1 cytochrome bd-I oxidase subunit CydX [Proteus vulgaris]MCE9841690.1 cytochrome bd-I oxidase subunit CydX [Proteus terrae]
MWYFAWLLGTLFACSIAVIAGLAFEHAEAKKASESEE